MSLFLQNMRIFVQEITDFFQMTNFSFKNLTNLNRYSWTFGLRVFIHNNSDFMSAAEQDFIETGKMTFLQLKKTFSYREPSPYSQCQNFEFFN